MLGNKEPIKELPENTPGIEAGTNGIYNKIGKAQSKPGIVPWNFIDWNNASTNSKNMYNTSTVRSGLITGTQWDVMANWITNKNNEELTNSESWGNHETTTHIITLGRMSYYSKKSTSLWEAEPFYKYTKTTRSRKYKSK